MANLRSFVGFCVLILFLEPKLPALADDSGNVGVGSGSGGRVPELCNIDARSFLPPPYGNLSSVICKPIWNTFILRVSFILNLVGSIE